MCVHPSIDSCRRALAIDDNDARGVYVCVAFCLLCFDGFDTSGGCYCCRSSGMGIRVLQRYSQSQKNSFK